MSLPNRPGYQKQTKSSSSSSASGGGGGPGGRWNGNYSAGVSPVRGLSPVRGTFHGIVGRQDMDLARSHTNPLFNSRTSDIGRGGVHTTPTKACKECKENRDKLQEPWKVPTDKAQYSGKTLINPSTPTGKSTRTTASMRFTTPPKPLVKRKILAENREFITTACPPTRMKEEEIKPQPVAGAPPAHWTEVIAATEPHIATAVSQSRNDESQSRAESDGSSFSAFSPERSTTTGEDASKPKSPLVSIEDLQKRIQKFLQDEGGTSAGATAADASVPVMLCSPRQSTESLRRSLSGSLTAAACSGESSSSLSGFIDEAPFQPVVAPYSPRPEFLRARRSPSMEGNVVSPVRGEADSLIQEKTTAATPNNAYDPKNNFLSPRPQFLRYRPLRRLELLRKSAEGTLCDLDLESPATDAGSSRMGSEKDVDEKEVDESESQDVTQHEVQSLKSSSSLESPPPRCKVSSYQLFSSAAVAEDRNGEIVQLRTREEPKQQRSSISSLNIYPEADVPSTDSKFDYLKGAGAEYLEEDADDSDKHSSRTWCYSGCCIVTIFAFVALLVVASGSPGLFPTSLQQCHISHLWKTSTATEPIRLFLQTTEGLWADIPHLGKNLSPSCLDVLRVGWAHVYSSIQSHVDLKKVVENGKVAWSFCLEYSSKFGRVIKESYVNLKASLEEESISHSSRNGQEEMNEWDWVPDYEFVVAHDMFDPAEAYKIIKAKVESWEVKSFWTSIVNFYAGHSSSKQIVLEPSKGWNASVCTLSSASPAEDEVILSFRLPAAALGRAIADIPVLIPSQDVEPTLNLPEQRDVETTPRKLNAVQLVQNDDQEIDVSSVVVTNLSSTPAVVGSAAENASDEIVQVEPFSTAISSQELNAVPLVHNDHQEVEVSSVVVTQFSSTPDVVDITTENASDEIGQVDPLSSPIGKQIPLSQGEKAVQLSHDVQEKSQLAARVTEDDRQLLEPGLSQEDEPVPFQERLQGDSEAEAVPVPTRPEENDGDSSMSPASVPVSPRSLFLDELMMQAPGFRTTAAIFASLLLAAGVALLVFHKMYSRTGNSRPAANLKVSEPAPGFSKSSVGPQFVETNDFYPIVGSPGSEFLAENESLAVRLSFDEVRQFSTPYPVTGGTPDHLLRKGTDQDSFEKSSKQVAHFDDTFQAPNGETANDSSLGLFTTMVPVVHNQGTAKERVQLTPVRRSSRIRTRMQSSPCHLMHSPHLCNC